MPGLRKLIFTFFVVLSAILYGCNGKKEMTTVFLVRHAEKDLTDTTDNPPLTAAGEERAQDLVDVIGDQPVDAIYSTPFDRNRNTVLPLANQKKVEIQTYDWHEWQPVIDKIKQSPGKSFVICGHGDNLLPMIKSLGGQSPVDSLGKHEYDKIFRVELHPDTTTVEMIRY